MSHSDIEFSRLPAINGEIGMITLQRPQALNALTLSMCKSIDDHLLLWQQDNNIKAVVIQGSGERAFCAGGDVRLAYEIGRKEPERCLEFFRQEYQMNRRLFHFTKPFIALMHGITMGGGLGVSVHGSHCVADESLILAMPETGIGFFPDIGASYFLPRCPGKLGWYLGLTGDKINAEDALYLGLIDFVIDRSDFVHVIEGLTQIAFDHDAHTQVSQLLKDWQLPIQQSQLLADQAEIDHYFTAHTVAQIFENLQKSSTPRGEKILQSLKDKSPTSLKITLQLLDQGALQDFDRCMDTELKLTERFLNSHDFYEGVRAAVIDKDRKPVWQPAKLSEVEDNLLTQWGI
jgi:enoyl-CoA hydratase